MVQQLTVILWGRLLTSVFGVFSVWIKIERTAPVLAYVWHLGSKLDESIRGLYDVLEMERVVGAICR